jgi:membrane associated rhomboid family serine protease
MSRSPVKYGWSQAFETSAMFIGLLFLVEVADYLLPVSLKLFGIHPREWWGLLGVLFAPLLHLGPPHLLANALPLFVLLVLLFHERRYRPEQTLGLIWMSSGLGTWLIGRGEAIHIGASGLIYGITVYLLVSGFLMRNWKAAFIALLVFLFYGGIFHGVLPQEGQVSWEGHLAGAVGGVWAARRVHRLRPR